MTRAVTGLGVLLAVMLAVGVLGRALVFESAVAQAELDWTRDVAANRERPLDTLARVGSSLADTWTVIGTAVGAAVALWAAGRRAHAALLPLGLAIELTVFLTVSTLVGRPRPAVDPLGAVPSTASFPSGHVAAAVVLYGGLAVVAASLTGSARVTRAATVPAVLAVLYVGASRVYEGVHHPTDVVSGAVVGAGALLVAAHSTGIVDAAALRARVGRGTPAAAEGSER